MAFSRQAHVIHTGGDGVLATTATADIDAMADAICGVERAVLHFHGGLVSEDAGFRTAQRLFGTYEAADAYPVFFVWRSGIREIVTGNLGEMAGEELFKRLLRKIVKYTVGKVQQTDGDRAAAVLPTPDEMSVNRELVRRQRDEEPYDHVEAPPEVAAVTNDERGELETEIAEDTQIQDDLAAVLAWHTGTTEAGARGVYVATPQPSRMSPDVLDQLAERDEGARGILGGLALAKKAAAVFVRVIQRFSNHTDHGVYPTTVEELLREFYLAGIGGALWQAMKRETLDTFTQDEPSHGGAYLLDRVAAGLTARAAAGERLPEITLVGHSTGAVFIDHLVEAVDKRRVEFPSGFRFRNVVFLAPACTYDHFATALSAARLIDRFRMFTMTDEAERADHLVRGIYPRSLLYFVAGVLERDDQGRSAYRRVAGMARYLDGDDGGARGGGLAAVRAYLTADRDRLVRSPSLARAALGLRSGATTHGGFDDDRLVLESVTEMIRGEL